jgi:hypothetical protein
MCWQTSKVYALRILVESYIIPYHIIYHIILFASLCVVRHIRVALSVLLYVVIPVVLLLFIV